MGNSMTYTRKDLPKSVLNIGIMLALVGAVIGIAGFVIDLEKALFHYIVAFMFIVSIAVGALFLVALEYVAGADWSTPIRRVLEFFASLIPFLFVLVIPLLFHINVIFEWADPKVVAEDPLVSQKVAYLNPTAFIIRQLVILALWTLFYYLIVGGSQKQDQSKDPKITKRNIIISAIFIPIFAISATVMAIDWMMTLAPHWYSTIFGVYFFSGSLVVTLAVFGYAVITLKDNGYLHPGIIDDHLFSIGALLFGFVNFWAYIAFSQFLLIWYANLPETTSWFLYRWEGGWMWVTLLLIIAHFIVPYAVLLPQQAKMNPKVLKFVALWIIFAHFVDLYWLVLPNLHHPHSGFLGTITGFGLPLFAIGIVIVGFYFGSSKKNFVPVGDPKLDRGLNFRL